MEVINVIDVSLVVNISIGVFIGLTSANMLSEILSKYILRGLDFVISTVGRCFFPLKFRVFIVGDDDHIEQPTFGKLVNFDSTNWSLGSTSTNLKFAIKPETRLGVIYKPSEVRVVLVDDPEKLGMLESNRKLPGRPIRFRLDSFTLSPNVIQHFSVHVRPKEKLNDYRIPIWIYYEGEISKDYIYVSMK